MRTANINLNCLIIITIQKNLINPHGIKAVDTTKQTFNIYFGNPKEEIWIFERFIINELEFNKFEATCHSQCR